MATCSTKTGPKALARRIGGVVVMILALGPAIVVSAPAAQASTPGPAATAQYEARVIYLMNRQRLSRGIHSVRPASCPDRYAEGYAPSMAHKVLVHRQAWSTRLHQNMYTVLNGCRATWAAENLAMYGSADQVVASWMRSPGHRANILNGRLNRVGVAAVYRSGRWFVVADFTRQ